MENIRQSSKYLNIEQFEILRKIMQDLNLINDFQLCFTTGFGMITGDFLEPNIYVDSSSTIDGLFEEANEKSINYLHLLVQVKDIYLKEFQAEAYPIPPHLKDLPLSLKDIPLPLHNPKVDLIGDGFLIPLTNVNVYKDNLQEAFFTTDIYYLHADSVIGFSLIPRKIT